MSKRTSVVAMMLVPIFCGGCLTDERSMDQTRQRQQDALNDPFNYNPQVMPTTKGTKTKSQVSDTDGLKRDLEKVLNP
jgi:hypothetical protein